MPWLSIAVIVYGIIVGLGGVMGYVSAQSPMSLVTGGLAGLLLIGAGIMARSNPKAGFGAATVLAMLLIGFFIYRYMETQKAMPAFGVIALSVVMLALLVFGHFMSSNSGATQ